VIDVAASGRAEAVNESAETHKAVRNYETPGVINEPSVSLVVEHRRLSLGEKGGPSKYRIHHKLAPLIYVSE
jgi:hypothetical protein